MTRYEYKVIPAPSRGQKAKGVRSAEGRFAHALEATMNDMAADGWHYQRAETLPSEERSGLTSKTTVFRNVLVFRRPAQEPAQEEAAEEDPKLLTAPTDDAVIAEPGPSGETDFTESEDATAIFEDEQHASEEQRS